MPVNKSNMLLQDSLSGVDVSVSSYMNIQIGFQAE
jgi:hypothetical protein